MPHKLLVSYGGQRAGLICVENVCRLVPAATGVKVSLQALFDSHQPTVSFLYFMVDDATPYPSGNTISEISFMPILIKAM